jgi:putative phage-type endonuclease
MKEYELKDISNNFIYKPLIDDNERNIIVYQIADIIDSIIECEPMIFSNYNFDNIIYQTCNETINIALKEIYDEYDHKMIEDIVDDLYYKSYNMYFNKFYPRRSYDGTFIRKAPKLDKMDSKIKQIREKPQPEQQTREWYEFRYKLITASSAWKAYKSQSTINQLIVDKCKPLNLAKYETVNVNSPFHHGHKYEPLSVMYYEKVYKTKIEDFGCIQHDHYKFLGASPDGINIDPNSPLYGRMLEIKNPVSRQLTGTPKEDYWIQMQLQMEVCNLNECDFLETVFKEYESEEEFNKDGSFNYTNDGKLKGVIISFFDENKPLYYYCPIGINKDEFMIWYNNIMNVNSHLTWFKNIYWRLEDVSCVLVLRNKFWFSNAIGKLEEISKIIEKEKVEGYEHRLPKRRVKKEGESTVISSVKPKCLIKVNKEELKELEEMFIDTS